VEGIKTRRREKKKTRKKTVVSRNLLTCDIQKIITLQNVIFPVLI
jgi:hypothetical protein